jgi:peptide/nickel transport system permease protein
MQTPSSVSASSATSKTRPETLVAAPSEFRRAGRALLRAGWPVLALIVLLIVGFFAVFGPNIAPKDPNRQTLVARLKPPLQQNAQGITEYPLGTDALGRDVLSRLIYGARVSISVGLAAVVLGGLIGITAGMVAGYFGGLVDDVIMRIADIQLGFPFVLLAIMVLVVLGQSVANLVIVLGIGQWVTYARIARGSTIAEREREHITASRAMGASNRRILLYGILPNITAPLIVIASFNVASVILSEATLSFLGLGVPPTVPTWGGMLAESRDQLLGGSWWLAVFPGLCIVLTVLSLNILGDWLRDFLDPRLRGAR